jgi:ribosomal protein S18 acetylase RimI-like enzyme
MDASKLPRVSTLFPEQFTETARALGRAFIDDPPFKMILPDVTEPVERAHRLGLMFEVALAIQRKAGQPVFGVMIDGKVVGAAVTEGAGHPSMAQTVLSGLGGLPKLVTAVGTGGTMRAIQFMNELAHNHPPEPHIYLNLLGVDPGYQGTHCGTAILEHLRQLAAERSSLCGVYLETATEANVAYYQARQYEVIGEIRPLGVRMWRMLQRRRA